MSIRAKCIDQALLNLVTSNSSTEFAQKYLSNKFRIHSPDSIEEFKKATRTLLTTKLDEKRVVAAVSVRRFLLRENDMEDWATFADQLTQKEMEVDFWPHYRDHTAHQALTFFLGAYLYENLPKLQHAVKQEYANGPAKHCDSLRTGFYYQWSTATLLHDFGYLLDVEKDQRDSNDARRLEKLQMFFDFIDAYLKDYILMVFQMGRTGQTSDEEVRALRELQHLLGHEDVKHAYTRREDFVNLGCFIGSSKIANSAKDAWELLNRIASTKSARFTGVFDNYFRILATHGLPTPKGALPIWDHGIASAVLFLKLSVFCWSYFDAVRDLSGVLRNFRNTSRSVVTEIVESIKKWDYSADAFHGSFLVACFAMALHNLRHISQSADIDRAGYAAADKEVLKEVSKNVLPIRLSDGVVPYLLMVVDQLQDWDRYPIVRTGLHSVLNLIEASDIGLSISHDQAESQV